MRPKFPAAVLPLTLLAACVLTAAAQGLTADSSGRARGESVQQPAPRIRENIITLKLLRMTQALNLSPAQTAVIYPTLTRLENEKYDATRKLNGVMGDLRLLVGQDRPDEKRILELMSAVQRLRAEITAKDLEMADFMKSKLSVVQDAQYMLFSVEFYRGLGERLERFRMFRHGKPFTQ